MDKEKNKRVYQEIGEGRLLNIRVVLDDNLVYEGRVEDAPDDIKKLKYSEIKIGSTITYYAYSELNN